MSSAKGPKWSERHQARLGAVDVVLAGRATIGDDMVVRDLLTRMLRHYTDIRWTTAGAAALGLTAPPAQRQVDHVVPINILVDRLLAGGASARDVLAAGGQCYVTKIEHHSPNGLAGFRKRHPDLRKRMQTCDLDQLLDLGWERYRRAGLEWTSIGPRWPVHNDDSTTRPRRTEVDDGTPTRPRPSAHPG